MNINKFMFELNNALIENLFRGVEVHRVNIDTDDVIAIRIIAERDVDKYDRCYIINKNWLDDKTINNIISSLIWWE